MFIEPSELVITLCSTGLYTTALHLCDEFKISKASVLESLTSQCIKLSQHEDPNAWDWLIQNDIFGNMLAINNFIITSRIISNFFSTKALYDN